MKHVYIVDDNQYKRAKIVNTVGTLYPNVQIFEFTSASDLVCAVKRDMGTMVHPNEYLVVTDMQMPMQNGERVDIRAGFTVLRQLGLMGCECPAIVVSGESISDEFALKCYSHYKGSIVHEYGVCQVEDYRQLLADD